MTFFQILPIDVSSRCSMDPYILKTPKYESNKPMASVDAFMMKFPDRTSPRRRREASAEVDSITIHSNTLMVFDVDAAEGVPQPLAHSEKLRIPTELCLSIAGFGILVSASTFLTTVTFAVAFANIYMKARNKW
ncbi:hypothetical protein DICVIV_06610 [Dictyocaulus viviparus]|uniref:Uncharacterized protein n=1 Tax=Dictyocaulus viviparus TaxID=29172 RepID=A0A0D8XU85_DICVI|nr:hypothetical protein DICVIV_06610 [Dictyocaulus viviparus]